MQNQEIHRFHLAAVATGNGNVLNVNDFAAVAVQIAGTFVATVTFEGSVDGSTWVSLQAIPSGSSTPVTTATAAGIWIVPVSGFAQMRSRVTWTSGTSITVIGLPSIRTQSVISAGGSVALATGSAIIGRVGIDQTTPGTTDSVTIKTSGYTSKVSVTRPANTNTYGAGDVVGEAAAAITFANIAPTGGGEIIITSASFERDVAALISGETSYVLHLYNVTPPSAFADEATWDLPSGDRASYLSSINLGTPVDLGSTLYVATDGINKQVTAASGSLFGYLVTTGSYVAASATVHAITLHAVKV